MFFVCVWRGGCTILQHVTSAQEVAGLTCGRMAKDEEVQLPYIRMVFLIVQGYFSVLPFVGNISDTSFRRAVYFVVI